MFHKKYVSTLFLAIALLILSVVSLFLGVIDMDLNALFRGDGMELKIFCLLEFQDCLRFYVQA